jgi:hypothetical protein
MGKKLRFWAGAVLGAALQYFYDPAAGRARRAYLRQQISDRVLDASDGLGDSRKAVGRMDHLRLWHMDPHRSASRTV